MHYSLVTPAIHITPRVSGAAMTQPTACDCYAEQLDHDCSVMPIRTPNPINIAPKPRSIQTRKFEFC